jgi:soluble lytic murein transglycosylase-like protein
MLKLKRLPLSSSFAISRNVFTQTPIKLDGAIRKYWWAILLMIVSVLSGSFYTYTKAIEWWNYEVYLKKQVAEVDTTSPVFTNALIKWIAQHTTGVPNTNREMITQIVITAFEESDARQVDPLLTLALIATESRFNYMATSPSGAKGLMQVIPYWHKDKISVVEVYNPIANVKAGTAILREYLKLSKGDVNKALLRYNGSLEVPGANYDKRVLRTRAELSKFIETQLRSNYGKNA